MPVRRVAAHEVIWLSEPTAMAAVEVADGVAQRCYHIDGEQPFTEWLGGRIEVRADGDGTLRAYKDDNIIM